MRIRYFEAGQCMAVAHIVAALALAEVPFAALVVVVPAAVVHSLGFAGRLACYPA